MVRFAGNVPAGRQRLRVATATAIAIAFAVSAAAFAACASHPHSIPLSSIALDSLRLDDRPVRLSREAFGRAVVDRPGWMAVQDYVVEVPSIPGRVFRYDDLVDLELAGLIDASTMLTLRYRRALVEGDSAAVAKRIASGKIDWHVVGEGEPLPRNAIFP